MDEARPVSEEELGRMEQLARKAARAYAELQAHRARQEYPVSLGWLEKTARLAFVAQLASEALWDLLARLDPKGSVVPPDRRGLPVLELLAQRAHLAQWVRQDRLENVDRRDSHAHRASPPQR